MRKPLTRSSMSLHSLLTEDLEMPVMPIACTSSSTRRVETPPIQASWITDTSAFSTVRRGSRKRGKVRSLAQLRDAQVERAEPRLQRPVAIAVAVGRAARPRVHAGRRRPAPPRRLHDDLQHRLGQRTQEIAVVGLLDRFDQRHSVLGHRVLRRLPVKRCNSTLADRSRWPPHSRRRACAKLVAVAPARRPPPISTISSDANKACPVIHAVYACYQLNK